MRTLGFAYQYIDTPNDAIQDGKLVANNLTFIGIAAIADPVRPDVPDAVKECQDAGIAVKSVTGDTPGTAKEIGRQIGLWTDEDGADNVTTGPEFERLTDEELAERDKLRRIYIDSYKQNLVAQLENTYLVQPDGTKVKVKHK